MQSVVLLEVYHLSPEGKEGLTDIGSVIPVANALESFLSLKPYLGK